MAQQTAVEWLYNLSKKRELDIFDLEVAMEKEKEQIIKAHKLGFYYNLPDPIVEKNSEQYYNETYNK